MSKIQVFIDFEAFSKRHSRIFFNKKYNCDLPFCYSIKINNSETKFFEIKYIVDFAPKNLKQKFIDKNKKDLMLNIYNLLNKKYNLNEIENKIQFVFWNGILEKEALQNYFGWELNESTTNDIGCLLKKEFNYKVEVGLDRITYFEFNKSYFCETLNFINYLENNIGRKILSKIKFGEIASISSAFCYFYQNEIFAKKLKLNILNLFNTYFNSKNKITKLKNELINYNSDDVNKLHWIYKKIYFNHFTCNSVISTKNINVLKNIYELNSQCLGIEKKINKLYSEISKKDFLKINLDIKNLSETFKKIINQIKEKFKEKYNIYFKQFQIN